MSMIIHLKNTFLFRTNFTYDNKLYNHPNLTTHTLSKNHPKEADSKEINHQSYQKFLEMVFLTVIYY